MNKISLLVLIFCSIIVCCMFSCNVFKHGNHKSSDRPMVKKTKYTVEQKRDISVNNDSSKLTVIAYRKIDSTPVQYLCIELVNFKMGLTHENGRYEILIPKGTYNIRIYDNEKYEIRKVEFKGGTNTVINVNLGYTLWR